MAIIAKHLQQTLLKKKIPAEILAQFDFSGDAENPAGHVVSIIQQMDALLSKEQCLSVMQEQGCCKTGKGDRAHRAFGRAHADAPLAEKVRLLNEAEMPHKAPCRLNPDGTLSVWWGFETEGRYGCVCSIVKKLPKPAAVPATFCGCCGGHIRHNYQHSLGVKLRLKKIVSSAASSGGTQHCEFQFEIVA